MGLANSTGDSTTRRGSVGRARSLPASGARPGLLAVFSGPSKGTAVPGSAHPQAQGRTDNPPSAGEQACCLGFTGAAPVGGEGLMRPRLSLVLHASRRRPALPQETNSARASGRVGLRLILPLNSGSQGSWSPSFNAGGDSGGDRAGGWWGFSPPFGQTEGGPLSLKKALRADSFPTETNGCTSVSSLL